MPKKSLSKEAAALAAKTHKLKEPLVVHHDEALDPKSGNPIYFFSVVDGAKGNEPGHTVILDDSGRPLKVNQALESLFDRTVLSTGPGSSPLAAAAPITIQPDSNILTLNPGETIDETITVTIPKNARPAKADVYFLADTTSSMGNILNAVKGGANNILAALSGFSSRSRRAH